MSEISVRGLGKRFGPVVAVDDVSFDVAPGMITGLLGANGSGKSTTMQLMVGLTRGAGRCTFASRTFDQLPSPRLQVGVMIGAAPFHPGRTGCAHLRMLAAGSGLPRSRVASVLDAVGLGGAAHRRIGTYSLGMRQRLSLAAALLGDPPALILDEPTNGLDPVAARWFRELLRRLADEGRSVLVSSHLLNEAATYLDHVVILDRGRVRVDERLSRLLAERDVTVVDSVDRSSLRAALVAAGLEVSVTTEGRVAARGAVPARIGEIAAAAGLVLTELAVSRRSLEDVFFELSGT